jgi:hypothetical protein
VDFRKARGREIARLGSISKRGAHWIVPSQSKPGAKYKVLIGDGVQSCTCLDFVSNGTNCKHIIAVIYRSEYPTPDLIDPPKPVIEKKKATYPQKWRAYNMAQYNEKPNFLRLLAGFCSSLEGNEPQGRGRPSIPTKDRVFLACYKVFEGVSSRRFRGDQMFAHLSGYVSCVPSFNSILNVFNDPDMTGRFMDLIAQTSAPLRDYETVFAADSSGFGNSRFDRWIDIKDPSQHEKQHTWTKAHLMSGVNTHIVTAVVIKDKDASDPVQLPELVQITAKQFELKEICADKAYGSIDNYDVIGRHGAVPYIAFKSIHTGRGRGRNGYAEVGTPLWQKMFHQFQMHSEEFYAHYHQRSNVETVFSMIKSKFRDTVRSKNETAMLNEVLCKIVCHNICVLNSAMYEFGLDLDHLLKPTSGKPNFKVIEGGRGLLR